MGEDKHVNDYRLVDVGDLGRQIGEDGLPSAPALVGRSMNIAFEDGSAIRLSFVGAHELEREVLSGPAVGEKATEAYFATSPRDGVYFIDYIVKDTRATTTSLVADVNSGCVTAVIGTLPTREEAYETGAYALAREGRERTLVRASFLRGAIDRPYSRDMHCHPPSTELVGKRVKYAYNNGQVYEHIYMHEKLYAYQCLSGIEKGLGGADCCDCFRIDDELYLFVWREKVVPTLGVLTIDWRAKRTSGKLFGYESDEFTKLTNVPVAAAATLLNITVYD